jgi:hypothetical protein
MVMGVFYLSIPIRIWLAKFGGCFDGESMETDWGY